MDITKTLVVTDLDGTLLNSAAELTPFSLAGIRSLQKKGLTFTFATARSPYSASEFLAAGFINAPAILMNGTLAVAIPEQTSANDTAMRTLFARKLPSETMRTLTRLVKDASLNAFLYILADDILSIYHEKPETDSIRHFIAVRTETNHRFIETENLYEEASKNGCIYLTMCEEKERLHDIYAQIQSVDGVEAVLCPDNYSRFWYVECYSAAASKANGALFLKQYTQSDNLIVFGDNHNDVCMFAEASLSVAVGDAQEEVRRAADCLCASHDEDGVVKKLLELFG